MAETGITVKISVDWSVLLSVLCRWYCLWYQLTQIYNIYLHNDSFFQSHCRPRYRLYSVFLYYLDQQMHNVLTVMSCFLVNDQRDTQIIFYAFISIYNSLHVSSTSCLSSGETNCINTASSKSFYVGGRDVCRLAAIPMCGTPHIGIAATRETLPDSIDCLYRHQLNNIICTAFVTT